MLVLRQEDERSRKEAELGWLLGRKGVVLRTTNDSANQNYEAAYRPFLESFVTPASWLETSYETEVIKHFYSAQEREVFKTRWSGGARPRRFEPPQSRAEGDGWATRTSAPSAEVGEAGALADESGRLRADLNLLRGRFRDGHAVDLNDHAYRPRERDWAANPGADALRPKR